MNWGIGTALDPLLAVRSGSALIRQASQQKKRCYHTVQEIHKARSESQFSASQMFFNVQNKPLGKSINIHKR